MSTEYHSLSILQGWKEHTCSACGCVFSYQFKRKIKGVGFSKDTAERLREATDKLQKESGTDMQPCPTCGLYQADMIGLKLANWIGFPFVIVIGVYIVLMLLLSTDSITKLTTARVMAGTIGVGVLWTLLAMIWNPNADPVANRKLSAARVSDGTIVVGSAGTIPSAELLEKTGGIPRQRVLAGLCVVALALAVALEALVLVRGWKLQPVFEPPVAGAGDTVRMKLDELRCAMGYWRGDPEVMLRHGSETLKASATSSTTTWGERVGSRNERAITWVDFTLPETLAQLNGDEITVEAQLKVTYPEGGFSYFSTVDKTLQRTQSLILASPGAGATYSMLWLVSVHGGTLLLLVISRLLEKAALAHRATANPTRFYK